ncbi:MAG: hypothetical protein L3J10_04945 [Sulfurimonas sp.]|nr:hypothetical protein [Sulfurimonas sp.]
MSDGTIVVIIIFISLWIYSTYLIFTKKFKDDKEKVFWRIGIVFVPFLMFFYYFIHEKLHEEEE